MTKVEAEEIFLSAVMSGETAVVVKMSETEVKTFRVLAGRMLKEMQNKNRMLWLKAREWGIEWKEPYAVLRRRTESRYPMYKLDGEELVEIKKIESQDGLEVTDELKD